jgi:hypothetical protein
VQAFHKFSRVIEGFASLKSDSSILCPSSALHVYVVEYLKMIRDEAYRCDKVTSLSPLEQILEVIENVWPQPGLVRLAGTLECETPYLLSQLHPYQGGRLQQFVFVWISFNENPFGKAVRGEDE